jgi:hypothetical protein
MFTHDENVNSIGYALKEIDKSISNIFVYTDIKKFISQLQLFKV